MACAKRSAPCAASVASASATWCTTATCRRWKSTPRPTWCAPTDNGSVASLPRNCRWRSATSCCDRPPCSPSADSSPGARALRPCCGNAPAPSNSTGNCARKAACRPPTPPAVRWASSCPGAHDCAAATCWWPKTPPSSPCRPPPTPPAPARRCAGLLPARGPTTARRRHAGGRRRLAGARAGHPPAGAPHQRLPEARQPLRPDARGLPPGQPACAHRTATRPPEDRTRPRAGRHAARAAPDRAGRQPALRAGRRRLRRWPRRGPWPAWPPQAPPPLTAPWLHETTTPQGRPATRRAHRQHPRELPAASLLRLIWLASPALPVGGFSYSEGLESAIENIGLASETAVADWLLDQLHLTQARSDMAVLAKALGAWRRGDVATVRALDDWVLHTRETSEQRLQTEQMGRSLCEWLRNQNRQHQASAEGLPAEPDPPVAHDTMPAPARMQQAQPAARAAAEPALPDRRRQPIEGQGYFTYPVAFAQAAATTQAPVRQVLLAYAFGWAENMVQAALKSMPLGQSAGQRILARLADAIPAAADQAIALMDSERQAFAPMLAILSARHETQYSRLFRS